MKLHEQLIEIVEHEARGAIDTLRHVTPLGHIESVLTEAAERITQLESDNAALTKRVAELEQRLLQANVCWHCHDCLLPAPKPRCEHCPDECDVEGCDAPGCQCAHEAELAVAHEFIADLQSQLEWTPVSAGLPTEPGVYEFEFRVTSKWQLNIHRYGFSWRLHERPLPSHPEEFDEFRRIELPKDGGT